VSDDAQIAIVAVPLALLALLAGIVVVADPGEWLARDGPPPAPQITVEDETFTEDRIELAITNEGPEPVRLSQVLVNEAYWEHTVEPDRRLERLETSTVTIPYPWVEGEAVEIDFVTADGATVGHQVEAAQTTQSFDGSTMWTYTLIGLLVGVLPVAAGVAWQPALKRLPSRYEAALLAFTVGLLAFLGLEGLVEAVELAERAPAPLGGPGLVLFGTVAALAGLRLMSAAVDRRSGRRSPLAMAYLIALAIGLHNFGEGLVIGAAYAVGEVALGTFLILGFTLHNVTEGPAIVAPLREASWSHLAGLAAVGGVPTIVGAWLGAAAFTPLLGAVFFSLGLGAIAQVIVEVGGQLSDRVDAGWTSGPVAAGALLGVAVMWATGVLT